MHNVSQASESTALLQNVADRPSLDNDNGTMLPKSGRRKHQVAVVATDSLEIQREIPLAQKAQQGLSFHEAISLYPTAIFWSLFFSLGVVMCAFDPQLLGNLYATPAFRHDFGYEYNGEYIISAPWQTGLSMGSPLGQAVGAFLAAYPMEWYGRKWTFGACAVMTAGCIFIQFFAQSLPQLVVGELLGGLVLGTYVVIAPAYASEVCPLVLRDILTSCTNLCFVGGQLLANCVIAGTSKLNNHWAYSAAFAIQWLWPIVILVGLPFAPESPWWLQRQGKIQEAEESLRQLASARVDVRPALATIIETDRLERDIAAGSTYFDCLKEVNVRRTEIAVGVYCTQVLSGDYLTAYATYFFSLAGLPVSQSFNMSIAYLGLGFLGTCVSWVLLRHFGRRTIFNVGLAILAILQILIAMVDCMPHYKHRPALAGTQSILMLVWNFGYGCSLGPICFVTLCEVSATRVRSKTIALATAAQAILGMVMTVSIPYLLNPDQIDARGKIGFLFGGLGSLCLLWSYFRVPELEGRTYKELDIMFERKVAARDFRSYVIT